MSIVQNRATGVAIIIMAISLCGCRHPSNPKNVILPVAPPDPPYFAALIRGHDLERRKDYVAAIKEYKRALKLSGGVNIVLRKKARIAVHNRLAACYRDEGDKSAAVLEFRASVALGDTKYAPKGIDKLLRSSVQPH